MAPRNTKIPLPFTATKPNPGGAGALQGGSFRDWVRADMDWKESQPQPDYTTGSGSGINNG